MKAYINDVMLDWCVVGDISESSEISSHRLENENKTIITDHITNAQLTFSITASLYSDNREENYEKLLRYKRTGEVVQFNYLDLYQSLLITNITKSINSLNVIDLSITFAQVEFAEIKRSPVPLEGLGIETKETTTKVGKQGTKRIGGELES